MATHSAVVTISSTRSAVDGDEDRYPGQSVALKNTGATTCYLGGSDVTSANGVPLAAGEWLSTDLTGADDHLYAVTASGTTTVAVLRTGTAS